MERSTAEASAFVPVTSKSHRISRDIWYIVVVKICLAFLSYVSWASLVSAEMVSTDQVNEALRELVDSQSCKDVMSTVVLNENPLAATTEDYLDMLVLRAFIFGFASAKKQSPEDALDLLLARCGRDLGAPFVSRFNESIDR